MIRNLVIVLGTAASLFTGSVAFSEEAVSSMTCTDVKTLEGESVAQEVNMTPMDQDEAPYGVLVSGLPEGDELAMNYNDIFGHGKQTDGDFIYVQPGTGDGTVEDLCGAEYNTMIGVRSSAQTYCGICEAL